MAKKKEQDLQRLIISNLSKYFEKPVKHAIDYNDAALRDSVIHYFGIKDDYDHRQQLLENLILDA